MMMRAVETAGDRGGGILMGVIPEGSDLRRPKTVGVLLPWLDGVLGHPGHAVFGVGHIESVPMDRHPGATSRCAAPPRPTDPPGRAAPVRVRCRCR